MRGTPPAESKLFLLRENIRGVFVGADDVVELVLIGLLSQGHILIEGVPGVGKTLLARVLARSIEGEFRRIQFTPDLLPSDVVGVSVFEKDSSDFVFRPGPIFANVVLADELNRTSPRTQSALLEAMNDFQVSVDGITHPLPDPFLVLATQNPVDHAGTYPLPDSQLDRFFLSVNPGYPTREQEERILRDQALVHPLEATGSVIFASDVIGMREEVRRVKVSDDVLAYLLDVVETTRDHPDLLLGASPRAGLALFRAIQAGAYIDGRDYTLPDDVKRLAAAVLAHRLVTRSPVSAVDGKKDIVLDVLDAVSVPM